MGVVTGNKIALPFVKADSNSVNQWFAGVWNQGQLSSDADTVVGPFGDIDEAARECVKQG